MSDQQDNRNNGILALARCSDLAPIAVANPLVSRGLASLESNAALESKSTRACHYLERGREAHRRAAEALMMLGFTRAYGQPEHYRQAIEGCRNDFLQAIQEYSEAIRIDPKYQELYQARAGAYRQIGEYEKAIEDLTALVRVDPDDWLLERADLWTAMKDFEQAIADCTEHIRLHPQESSGYFVRAENWQEKRDYGKAIADYHETIRLSPSCPAAYSNLAWLLATCPEKTFRDGNRAVGFATKACELDEPTDKSVREWEILAAAHAESSRFDEAVRFQIRALEGCTELHASRDSIRQRLALYKAREPYPLGSSAVPSKVAISFPGKVGVRARGWSTTAVLAETPGIVEINSTTVAEAFERKLLQRKQRYEKLRDLNAPDSIIQSEMRFVSRSEDLCKNADFSPDNQTYWFTMQEGHFNPSEFEAGIGDLSGLPDLVLD